MIASTGPATYLARQALNSDVDIQGPIICSDLRSCNQCTRQGRCGWVSSLGSCISENVCRRNCIISPSQCPAAPSRFTSLGKATFCRGERGSYRPNIDFVFASARTVAECQQACRDDPRPCYGVMFTSIGGGTRCEVWLRFIAGTARDSNGRAECYRQEAY
eukprot:g52748.t1